MKPSFIIAIALLVATPATGQEESLMQDAINGAQTAGFKIFDKDEDGKATPAEILEGSKEVFAALDQDQSGFANAEEFQAFSMGFQPLADRLSRQAEYREARNAIFTRWDMDANQELSVSEVAAAILTEAFTAGEASIDQAGYGKSQFIAEMSAVIE
jgi:EF hand